MGHLQESEVEAGPGGASSGLMRGTSCFDLDADETGPKDPTETMAEKWSADDITDDLVEALGLSTTEDPDPKENRASALSAMKAPRPEVSAPTLVAAANILADKPPAAVDNRQQLHLVNAAKAKSKAAPDKKVYAPTAKKHLKASFKMLKSSKWVKAAKAIKAAKKAAAPTAPKKKPAKADTSQEATDAMEWPPPEGATIDGFGWVETRKGWEWGNLIPEDMPDAAQPQVGRGKLSYTLKKPEHEDWAKIEVLLAGKAFKVMIAEGVPVKGQEWFFSWRNVSVPDAWEQAAYWAGFVDEDME